MKKIPTLASNERLKMRMRSVANSFTKTDRILTGDRSIKVLALDNGTARQHGLTLNSSTPGFSSYPNIVLNVSAFDEVGKTSTLVGLLGLNYHELSHLMFTPREFKQRLVQEHGSIWGFAFNLLEDQRIESFFTALYEPAGKFFTETFIRFILSDDKNWPYAFTQSYGRGFLPLDIRQELEARFVRPDLIDEVKDVIDSYKRLKSWDQSRVNSKARKIIYRMVKIIQEINPPKYSDCGGGDAQENGTVDEEREDEARKKDAKRQRKEERTGEDQSNFWEEDDEDEEGSGDDSDSEDDEDDSNGVGSDAGEDDDDSEFEDSGNEDDADSDGSSDSDGSEESSTSDQDGSMEAGADDSGADGDSSDDEDDGSASEPQEQGSDGAGGSDSITEPEFDDDELKDYLDEISEAIENDQNVQSEIGRLHTAMNDNTNIDVIDFGAAGYREIPASAEVISSVSKVQQQFRRLWADVEPGWKYGSDIGKLNTYRAMLDPENYDEMFDEWDEGREQDTGLEVFISLDISISMQGQEIVLASEAMYALKRGLDEIDAKVTVVGFHYWTEGLFDRNKKAGRMVPVWDMGGSTQPAHSIKLARSVLTASPMPNKLFVIITDGDWLNSDENGNHIGLPELIETVPGTRMYVGVGASASNPASQRKFHVQANVTNPMDIVPLVEKTVQKMIESRVY
jgi:hypothetical protein